MSFSRLASRRAALFVLVTMSFVLGGCLSSEEDSTAAANAGTPPTSGNTAPTISGAPPTSIAINSNYSFTPSASDADGDTLTFSINNLPDWASFDTSTGTLSGQPLLGNVGVDSNIGISVSDGQASDSLPAFSITVNQVALGSVSLSWSAPTQNSDGSALTDLAGYNIYYGSSQGSYPNSVHIASSGITTYVVENLSPATYFFVATAENSLGIESQYSNEVTKVVN